jgi:hypothetical protein
MDPVRNPYSPGAGSPPPELAGRQALLDQVGVAIQRILLGNPARSVLMVGLRGVGKTVLLEKMRKMAEGYGADTIRIEIIEGRSLPGLLAPQLRLLLHRLNLVESAKAKVRQAFSALAGFVKGLKIKYGDIEVKSEHEVEPGLADNGDLELDLIVLLEAVGQAAKAAGRGVVIFLDEIQYLPDVEFAAMIMSLHRCSQLKLPIAMIGAGLPQVRGLAGNAKSYAERLFEYPEVGALSNEDAALAIVKPAEEEGVAFDPEAVARIVEDTKGYPYFLQEWGKHAWDIAEDDRVRLKDAETAGQMALEALDAGFFRVRFDRLNPSERRYLRAMAELGPGPHRSGDISEELDRKVNSLAPVRKQLIQKGMIWSPNHGDTAFTVPLFDEYMKRIMPGEAWRSA